MPLKLRTGLATEVPTDQSKGLRAFLSELLRGPVDPASDEEFMDWERARRDPEVADQQFMGAQIRQWVLDEPVAWAKIPKQLADTLPLPNEGMPSDEQALQGLAFAMGMTAVPGGSGGLGSGVRLPSGYYSKLEKAVTSGEVGGVKLAGKKAPVAANVLDTLKRKGMISKDELEMTGIGRLLEEKGTERIPLEDVQKVLKTGEPTTLRRETRGFDPDAPPYDKLDRELAATKFEMLVAERKGDHELAAKYAEKLAVIRAELDKETSNLGHAPKYEDYITQGPYRNYRETQLKLEPKSAAAMSDKELVERLRKKAYMEIEHTQATDIMYSLSPTSQIIMQKIGKGDYTNAAKRLGSREREELTKAYGLIIPGQRVPTSEVTRGISAGHYPDNTHTFLLASEREVYPLRTTGGLTPDEKKDLRKILSERSRLFAKRDEAVARQDVDATLDIDYGLNKLSERKEKLLKKAELELTKKKSSLHLDDLQSDWVKRGEQFGFAGESDEVLFKKNFRRVPHPDGDPNYHMVQKKELDIAEGTKWVNFTIIDSDLPEVRLIETLKQNYKLEPGVPDTYLKDNWWKLGLKEHVLQAVKADVDAITMTTGEAMARRWSQGEGKDVFFKHLRDKKAPNFLERRLGVKREERFIESPKEYERKVHYFPLPKSFKEKVRKEGLDWSYNIPKLSQYIG